MTVNELKELLSREGYTCAAACGEEVITSRERGIRPLVELIASGKELRGAVAADKIVGKAAALLYAYLGVSALYAEVASEGAVEVCKRHGISLSYGVVAPEIVNRKGDGICPMEEAVAGIEEPRAAYLAVTEKLKRLSRG